MFGWINPEQHREYRRLRKEHRELRRALKKRERQERVDR